MTADKRESAPVYNKTVRVNKVFAFISLFYGYALVRNVLFTDLGIGMTAFVLLFVTGSVVFMRLHGVVPTAASSVVPALMLIFSAVFIVSGSEWVRGLSLCFEVLAAVYWYASAFCCCAEGKLGDNLPFDLLGALIVLPFSSFFAQPRFTVSALKSTKAGRSALYIIIGAVCAVIPAAVIITLLVSADDAFANLMELIYNSFLWSAAANLIYLAVGVPVAMYIFGLMLSSSSRKNKDIISADGRGRFRRIIGFMPPAAVYSALTVILAVYILFFLSQSSYFLSAFASLIPDGYSYADYARKGFFELCRVAAINGVLVVLAELLIRRAPKDGTHGVPENGGVVPGGLTEVCSDIPKPLYGLRVYNILMGVSTLVLITVAAAKLYMYIDCYGLTPARVNAAWFTLLLGVAFVFLIIRQAAPRFNFWRATAVAFVILFTALSFSNADSLIARYNINRFYDGSLSSVDVELFYSLSDSALPELAELLDRNTESGGKLLDEDTRSRAEQCLEYRLDAACTRKNSATALTERVNYALGYNLSRSEVTRLLKTRG